MGLVEYQSNPTRTATPAITTAQEQTRLPSIKYDNS
jgi:hypothetical protein